MCFPCHYRSAIFEILSSSTIVSVPVFIYCCRTKFHFTREKQTKVLRFLLELQHNSSTNVCAQHCSDYKANKNDFLGADDGFGIIHQTMRLPPYLLTQCVPIHHLRDCFRILPRQFPLKTSIWTQSKCCLIVTHLKSLISGASSSFSFFQPCDTLKFPFLSLF